MASRLASQVRESLRDLGVPEREPLVVGVSAGADSVALLRLLCEWSAARVIAVYVDHGLREGTEREARFVASLAIKLGASFEGTSANVKALQAVRRGGVEEAARIGRYQALAEVAQRRSCAWIATAHTADDQAETLLWRLLRGGAIESLAGVRKVRSLGAASLVRPLLSVSRAALREYLKKREQAFIEDPSNRSMELTRNRLRAEVMPLLTRENPLLVEGLCRVAEEATAVGALVERETLAAISRTKLRAEPGAVVLSIRAMKQETRLMQERILRGVLPGVPLTHGQSDALLRMLLAAGGRSVCVGGVVASRHRDELIVTEPNR